MEGRLTAKDLWPLIEKLSAEEQRRLAAMALRAATGGAPTQAYRLTPPGEGEFSSDDDPLAWDAEGWDEFNASR